MQTMSHWITFRCPEGFLPAVAERAREKGLSASELMRNAILADLGNERDDAHADHEAEDDKREAH